ncbi:hypothetical protein D3C87_2063640 [compost metagenome]
MIATEGNHAGSRTVIITVLFNELTHFSSVNLPKCLNIGTACPAQVEGNTVCRVYSLYHLIW